MGGTLSIDLFTTLDGVMQSPGGRDEDPEGAFAYGGWQGPIDDDLVGERVIDGIRRLDALLLGRKTYDIFAPYWSSYDPDGPAAEIARIFTAVPKYVATRGNPELAWAGTERLGPDPGPDVGGGPDLAAGIERLRERHRDIHVIGSVELARSLIAAGLFDVLNLWMYPLVVGAGKRLFPDDGPARGLRLLEPAVSGPQGAVLLRYGPGPAVRTADMG